MALGVACVVLGLIRLPTHRLRLPRNLGLYAALIACGWAAIRLPAGFPGLPQLLSASRLLSLVALAIVGCGLVLRRGKETPGTLWFGAVLVVSLAAALVAVKAGPDPRIDVWSMDQAAAQGLLHGQNFYTLKWTSGVPGEVSNLFAYLPGSVLLQAPFEWVFGDVRYALIAAEALASICVFRMSRGSHAWVLASLLVLVPKLGFAMCEAWTDPLLLVLIVGTALAIRRGHGALAVALFAAALSCKQYGWLFIPAAAAWPEFGWRRTMPAIGCAAVVIAPWALADPHAFWTGAFAYNLHLPARWDSLSVYSLALRHSLTPGYGFIGTGALAAVALSVWLARAGGHGFVLGSGLVMAGFDLVSKQAFFNEWALAGGLVAAGAAMLSGIGPTDTPAAVAYPSADTRAYTQFGSAGD